MAALLSLFGHEIKLHVRKSVHWVALILFFVIVILFLPFALGPEPVLLRRLAPGLIWIAALLMTLLSLDRLFLEDSRDGTLDLMMLSPHPLPVLVALKLIAQIVILLGALLLMLGPTALLLGMDIHLLLPLALTLCLGIPSLLLIGGVMSALTIMMQRNAALLMLLLVPFYIPVLIFAVGVCDAAAIGAPVVANYMFLAAALAFLLPSAPILTAYALRSGVDA